MLGTCYSLVVNVTFCLLGSRYGVQNFGDELASATGNTVSSRLKGLLGPLEFDMFCL